VGRGGRCAQPSMLIQVAPSAPSWTPPFLSAHHTSLQTWPVCHRVGGLKPTSFVFAPPPPRLDIIAGGVGLSVRLTGKDRPGGCAPRLAILLIPPASPRASIVRGGVGCLAWPLVSFVRLSGFVPGVSRVRFFVGRGRWFVGRVGRVCCRVLLCAFVCSWVRFAGRVPGVGLRWSLGRVACLLSSSGSGSRVSGCAGCPACAGFVLVGGAGGRSCPVWPWPSCSGCAGFCFFRAWCRGSGGRVALVVLRFFGWPPCASGRVRSSVSSFCARVSCPCRACAFAGPCSWAGCSAWVASCLSAGGRCRFGLARFLGCRCVGRGRSVLPPLVCCRVSSVLVLPGCGRSVSFGRCACGRFVVGRWVLSPFGGRALVSRVCRVARLFFGSVKNRREKDAGGRRPPRTPQPLPRRGVSKNLSNFFCQT